MHASATTNIIWIHKLLTKVIITLLVHPPVLKSDNLGAKPLASNPVYQAHTKQVELDVHYVRNLV